MTPAALTAPAPRYYRLELRRGRKERIVTAFTDAELEAKIAPFAARLLGVERLRTYTCSVCGTSGPWRDGWQWYGAYRDVDDGKPIVIMCSDVCHARAKERRLVPRNAATLRE
jgi:hypothetical protein